MKIILTILLFLAFSSHSQTVHKDPQTALWYVNISPITWGLPGCDRLYFSLYQTNMAVWGYLQMEPAYEDIGGVHFGYPPADWVFTDLQYDTLSNAIPKDSALTYMAVTLCREYGFTITD